MPLQARFLETTWQISQFLSKRSGNTVAECGLEFAWEFVQLFGVWRKAANRYLFVPV